MFERLFGDGGSTAQRMERARRNRSILDSVREDLSRLQGTLGPSDRVKVSGYVLVFLVVGFVVVFAAMPFAFEGRRRREQAETALNELAVLSNALVTFVQMAAHLPEAPQGERQSGGDIRRGPGRRDPSRLVLHTLGTPVEVGR